MTTVAATSTERARLSFGPWLWGPGVDLSVFAGSAAFALGLVALRHAVGGAPELPEWAWLAFVLGIDVAHVYATLFRTYFDRDELGRHPRRYVAIPIVVYALGVALYSLGAHTFWRILAYSALFHFVRQQVGWVALYRARAGQRSIVDKVVDDACIYAATLYPVLHWHTRVAKTDFAWFVSGDFVDLAALSASLVPAARVLWAIALVAFFARQAQLLLSSGTLHVGKSVVAIATASIWYVGIVGTNSDFDFTVTNVIVHGVPYIALLWAYTRARGRAAPSSLAAQVMRGGFAAFFGLLFVLAFVEEMAWDRLVWVSRGWLFGDGGALGALALTVVVPLLAVPQATHYVLDGMLWRRRDTGNSAAQRAALGFAEGNDR